MNMQDGGKQTAVTKLQNQFVQIKMQVGKRSEKENKKVRYV